ncbi:hypothetical protein Vretifemale_2908 [Volvox reticuliferus]|uniref:Uncharacterized protein n=1 Tax=Volvox reticuliferus TaxID=1737510 RepID=A0A8J4BZE7_9CHLO|nr:hypothetical protein Vretifemale_2908 [Volvox reticuliferus]
MDRPVSRTSSTNRTRPLHRLLTYLLRSYHTHRTMLGSNSSADGGGGGTGGSGATAEAEAHGVMQLTTLLGPACVQPALRPRSPHIGVGGILTGSSNSAPGLHVPLELDPPPRPPPPKSATATGGATSPSALLRRSLEFSDGISSLGSPGAGAAAATAAAVAAAAGDRTGTPLTASIFDSSSSLPASVRAVMAPRAGPAPHVRCGARELTLEGAPLWSTERWSTVRTCRLMMLLCQCCYYCF